MANKYLTKIANFISPDTEKDLVNTGTVGLAGGATTALADKWLNPHKVGGGKSAFGVGLGLGLVGDYAALRLNKRINHHIDEINKS